MNGIARLDVGRFNWRSYLGPSAGGSTEQSSGWGDFKVLLSRVCDSKMRLEEKQIKN